MWFLKTFGGLWKGPGQASSRGASRVSGASTEGSGVSRSVQANLEAI